MQIDKLTDQDVVGRVETVDFPEFNIVGVRAKVDTGAYRCVIHSESAVEENTPDGPVLVFTLFGHGKNPTVHTHRTSHFTKIAVRSSNGHTEDRYKINTTVRINGKEITTEFTLSNRAKMVYPVLIGRRALYHNFVVNVEIKR